MRSGSGEQRRSPLDGVVFPEGLREVPFLQQLDVRLDPADDLARIAVESVIGPLPLVPNTVHGAVRGRGGSEGAVLWLGPDEWLIVGPDGSTVDLEAQLRRALGAGAPDRSITIVDVSSNRTTLELDHRDARQILAGGCSIDFHQRAFGPGRCAQTLLGRAQVVLWQIDDRPTYRLLVRPSFAAYLGAWLTDAIGDSR